MQQLYELCIGPQFFMCVFVCVVLQSIADIEHDEVQYVVSSLVHPYPNDIFSVWVYVISVVPNIRRR